MRQSEINGLLRVFKGASVKMPIPQLEILHPPQPLSELVRCLWNKGLPVCNQKMREWTLEKRVQVTVFLQRDQTRTQAKEANALASGQQEKKREDERSLGLPVHMSIVYFPWPSIHPIHSCLSKSNLQTMNQSSAGPSSVLRLWSVCGHLP